MRNQLSECKSINLGGYHDNDFKESDSIAIATDIIEKNKKCKAHLQKEDKTPNIDGRISILLNSFEFQIVEAQVKSLPMGTDTTAEFKYVCETKIINFAKFKVSANPIALFVVDRNHGKLFFKMMTPDYIEFLNIGKQKTKTLRFDSVDEYSDESFIAQALKLAKITYTNTACFVDCDRIRRIIRDANKIDYRYINDYIEVHGDQEGYTAFEKYLVYKRGCVTGYMAAFRIKDEDVKGGKDDYAGREYKRDGLIEMIYHKDCNDEANIDLGTDEYSIAFIRFEKGYIRVVRQPSNGHDITDADFGNIILEIAKEMNEQEMPVLYFNKGPVYWFEGAQMYQMKSEKVELPWNVRL